jgi:hypothetical protein
MRHLGETFQESKAAYNYYPRRSFRGTLIHNGKCSAPLAIVSLAVPLIKPVVGLSLSCVVGSDSICFPLIPWASPGNTKEMSNRLRLDRGQLALFRIVVLCCL